MPHNAPARRTAKDLPKVQGKKKSWGRRKSGRRADKDFQLSTQRTIGGPKDKRTTRTAPAQLAEQLNLTWIDTGTSRITVKEPVITYLTTIAAHQAVQYPELLLHTVEVMLRQGGWELAFTDDSLASIVKRCHRTTHASCVADFLSMVQYLQLVFKVSRYVVNCAKLRSHMLTTVASKVKPAGINVSRYLRYMRSTLPAIQMLRKRPAFGLYNVGLRREASWLP